MDVASPIVLNHDAAEATEPGRRGFLKTVAAALAGGVGAGVAAIISRAAVGSKLVDRPATWVRAGRLDDLETNIPTPVTLRVMRRDGYLETVDQQVVFLVRNEQSHVRALSSSCAHLGCSVGFDRQRNQFLCPCHEGVFNLDGTVAAGPPPRPLSELAVRVEKTGLLVQV
jgi:Rieske Fe-S protein